MSFLTASDAEYARQLQSAFNREAGTTSGAAPLVSGGGGLVRGPVWDYFPLRMRGLGESVVGEERDGGGGGGGGGVRNLFPSSSR